MPPNCRSRSGAGSGEGAEGWTAQTADATKTDSTAEGFPLAMTQRDARKAGEELHCLELESSNSSSYAPRRVT